MSLGLNPTGSKYKPKVDPAALAVKDRRRAAMLDKAKADLVETLDDRFDDAVAHAMNAMTKTAKDAAEGRPTVASIRQNRSHEAARKRLIELAKIIAEAVVSARRAFFSDAAVQWRNVLAEELLRPAPHIAGMVAAAADELYHGRPIRDECLIQAGRAADDMERALVLASSRATDRADEAELIHRWADRWRLALKQLAAGMLDDAAYRCDYLAGRAVVRPGLLHPDPSIPWE